MAALSALLAVSAFILPHRDARGSSSRRAPSPRLAIAGRGAAADLTPGEDLYVIVGVPQSASAADIRAAYRKRARILHPDISTAADAAADFRRLSAAAEILLSPRREEWRTSHRTSEGEAEWTMDTEWTMDPQTSEDNNGWRAEAKKWGPVWSAVVAPWLSWHLFVAIDTELN